MLKVETIKNKPLADQVADHFLEYIEKNQLEIGAKLPNEFEMAELFGVGRSTIREAIKTMISKNILEVKRGDGTYVVNTSEPESDPLGLNQIKDKQKLALDVVDVRLLLEPEFARMAAERATKEEIEALIEQCDFVEAKIRAEEPYIEEDIELHTSIARCSGNAVIENLLPLINSTAAMRVEVTSKRLALETIETHRAIVDAISRRDSVGAGYAMVMHLTCNRQRIKRQYEF